MNAKQQRFVQEYLIDLNGTQAAVRAGYSERTAGSQAHDLLKKPEIREAMDAAMNERAKRTQVTADRVVLELSRLAFANMGEYVQVQEDGTAILDLSQLNADQAAAIQELTSEVYIESGDKDDPVAVKRNKIKLHPRCQALDLLGKHLGMFVNRHEFGGELPPVRIEYVKPDE